MKKLLSLIFIVSISFSVQGQHIKFEEYKLDNELHVILHQDNTSPVVSISISYHVGAKNEDSTTTGFAHLAEHLLFKGSNRISRGEYIKYSEGDRGRYNVVSNIDRTYYNEIFPSNKLEIGLWLEAERMIHARIDTIATKYKYSNIGQSKGIRYHNIEYSSFVGETSKRLFKKHPYHWISNQSIENLTAKEVEEFKEYYHKYYVPNNAVLTIAGDIDIPQTKIWVEKYFGSIAEGKKLLTKRYIEEPLLASEIVDTIFDDNVKIPAVIMSYRTPKISSRNAYVMKIINDILSVGDNSRIHNQVVDKDKLAIQTGSLMMAGEDYSGLSFYGLLAKEHSMDALLKAMDKEIETIKTKYITGKEYEREINQLEFNFIAKNRTMQGISESLSDYYLFYKNTNLINTEIDIYRRITKQDIMRVANKYLNKQHRVVLYYYPKKEDPKTVNPSDTK